MHLLKQFAIDALPSSAHLRELTPEEAAAGTALAQPDGATLRLEQERIPYGQVEMSLRQRWENRV